MTLELDLGVTIGFVRDFMTYREFHINFCHVAESLLSIGFSI